MAGPNLYDLFFAEDGTSQAQALAEALRRRRGEGELVALTGSRKLAPFAQAQLRAAEQGDQQLAAAGQEAGGNRLRRALQASQQQFQGQEGVKDRGLRRSLAEMDLTGQMARAAATNKLAAKKMGMETEEGLRKELMGNPVTKATQEVAMGFEKVKAAAQNPSAAGDLSLVFGYMKMLDPGSTVREGEYATAENARGVPDTIRNMWNRALAGERLAPEQRQDFLNQAGSIFKAQMGRFRPLEESYRGLASNAGADPSRVAIDLGLGDEASNGASGQAATGSPEIIVTPDGKRYRRQADGNYLPEG